MPIITMSRGSMSGGKALAEMVAEKLNCNNIVSREVLLKASEEYGVTEQELTDAMQKPPRFLERSAVNPRRLYLTLIRAVLLDYASKGCLVYHGNAGHFLLKDVNWVLKVRLIATLGQRIAAVQKTMNLDCYEATHYIKKVDEDRNRWTRFLYNEDWSDPAHFDIVVNLRTMSLETASNLIDGMTKFPEFRRTEERVKDVKNKALAAKVQAALELNPKTRGLDLEISAGDTRVLLAGKIEHANHRSLILQVAGGVSGVSEVKDGLFT